MGILERDPVDTLWVDTVIVLQDAADPHGGGLAVGAHTHAPAREPIGRNWIGTPAQYRSVLKSPHDCDWQEHERLAIALRLNIGGNGHFAHIETLLAYHGFEKPVRRLDVGEG